MTESLFAASLQTMHGSVLETVELAARVVAKFPAQTLPPALAPLAKNIHSMSVRFSSFHEDQLVLTLEPSFLATPDTFHMPARWVGASQGEVAKEVRKLYWDYQEERKRRETEGLRHRLGQLTDLQVDTQRQIDSINAQLAEHH